MSINGSPLAFEADETETPSRAMINRLQTPSTLSRSRMTRNLANQAEGNGAESSSDRRYILSDTEDDDSAEEGDDSFELPDAEAYEAKLLAQGGEQTPTATSKPSRKPKRAPSLLFRQSMGGLRSRQSLGLGAITPAKSRGGAGAGIDENLVDIELSDGRTISFNPMSISPGRIQAELDEGGVSKDEQERVQARIKDEAMAALMLSMKKWQVA